LATIDPVLEDTPPQAQRRYAELLRRMTPEQRLRATQGLCAGIRRATWRSLQEAFPHASAPELRLRLAARLYGRAEAKRLFGALPDDAR
jgi:hypothetical protein